MEEKEIQIVDSFRVLAKNIVNFFESYLLKESNISCSELSILKTLYESEKEDRKMNITELSSSLKITKSATSQLVTKLEKKGFVKRKINLFDKKIYYICLTEEGKSSYEDSITKYNNAILKVANEMGEDDCKVLSRLLEKLSDVIYSLGEVE